MTPSIADPYFKIHINLEVNSKSAAERKRDAVEPVKAGKKLCENTQVQGVLIHVITAYHPIVTNDIQIRSVISTKFNRK